MKVFFIGTVEFSKKALQKLIDMKVEVVGVATKEASPYNSDFAELAPLCVKNAIPFKFVDDVNSKDAVDWIKMLCPDYIFCFGWSDLLKSQLLNIPRYGTIGYHPAALPQNRGRHPLIWALALGLEKSASTFFFINEGTDSGDILSQVEFDINYEDNARTLKDRVHVIALKQIEKFVKELRDNICKRLPQDNAKSNIWRKRTLDDGEIDFRMSSRAIYNLVRALAKPYPGAHVDYKGKKVKVWNAKEIIVSLPNIEYGKVLNVENNEILVKCYDNAILLTEHEFEELPKIGGYLT